MIRDDQLLQIRNIKKWFPIGESLFSGLVGRNKPRYIRAVDGVSLEIGRGEILGLAGESGCGKTTTGMTILRLYDPTSGEIVFNGRDIAGLTYKELKEFRRDMQMVFQDPYQSLNPRFTVLDTVKEPIDIHKIGSENERTDKVLEALEKSGLTPPEDFLEVYPHQMSGGQRQRVVIAKAIVLGPKFIVADEPVSMLDVSIRASILNLLRRLADEMGLGILYVSHDLSTIRYICNRTAIMYLGKIVEIGPTQEVIKRPLHPYVRALLAAVPVPDPFHKRRRVEIPGEVLTPIDLPEGCRFRPRCSQASEICQRLEPELKDVGDSHKVACHNA
jgi:peptide/nickel transport system ATP-binding protein